MQVELVTEKEKEVKPGDILVFKEYPNRPYMIVPNRGNGNRIFDLLSMEDYGSFWTGNLSMSEVKKYAEAALHHYSGSDYKLVLQKR
jgi:hypothetical protein